MIHKTLALAALDCATRPLTIADAKSNAVGIAEVKLAQIRLQMLFAAMLINAFHAALEDAEKSFDGVGCRLAANIFAGTMIDSFVGGERFARLLVELRFVRIERAIQNDIFAQVLFDRLNGQIVNFDRNSATAALDHRKDFLF